MEAVRPAYTEDCYSVQIPQGFHPKKGSFGKKYLAALSKGGEDGGASSSEGEDEEEMSKKGDTTKDLQKWFLQR